MITPVESIPFSQYMDTAQSKLSNKSFEKNPQKAELEKLESGTQPHNMTSSVNALFDGAEGNKIQFENVDKETIIKIVDPETDEVIRQIPPEELMEMKSKMEDLTGQFIDSYV